MERNKKERMSYRSLVSLEKWVKSDFEVVQKYEVNDWKFVPRHLPRQPFEFIRSDGELLSLISNVYCEKIHENRIESNWFWSDSCLEAASI